MRIHNPSEAKSRISFNGLLHVDRKNGNINDSWFFRDYPTLQVATEHIKSTFPNGAEVLDYACSNGEELISLKSLLDDPKYKIIGYDCSNDALKLANRGVYTLFSNWYDSYLMQSHTIEEINDNLLPPPEIQRFLRQKFHTIMEPIDARPEYKSINNKANFVSLKRGYKDFREDFYRIKQCYKDQIDIRRGDIMNIATRRTDKPVGAVFFRNAIYQLCENNIDEGLFNLEPINMSINRRNILKELVNNIHSVLEENGLFVIGTHIKEHLFWADGSMKFFDTESITESKFFKNSKYTHLKPEALCAKLSPLVECLTKGDKFIPIGFSNVSDFWGGLKIPTVWRKIR